MRDCPAVGGSGAVGELSRSALGAVGHGLADVGIVDPHPVQERSSAKRLETCSWREAGQMRSTLWFVGAKPRPATLSDRSRAPRTV
jgi:hypothetical protein